MYVNHTLFVYSFVKLCYFSDSEYIQERNWRMSGIREH